MNPPSRSVRLVVACVAATGLAAAGLRVRAQPPARRAQPPAQAPGARPTPADSAAQTAMMGEMGHDHGAMADMSHDDMTGHGSPEEALHMRLTPARTPTHADSVRAAALVDTVRRALARYADPAAAEADGYKVFLPNVRQQVYHYTNYGNAFREAFRFDPTQPTSLLYGVGPDGRRRLLGAMYTAPARWDDAQLNARVPLSVAHWHQHVNWCLPPNGGQARWGEMRDGKPVFGPASPIATRAACDAVGGTFHDRVFGWMVHVNAFAADPAQLWAH